MISAKTRQERERDMKIDLSRLSLYPKWKNFYIFLVKFFRSLEGRDPNKCEILVSFYFSLLFFEDGGFPARKVFLTALLNHWGGELGTSLQIRELLRGSVFVGSLKEYSAKDVRVIRSIFCKIHPKAQSWIQGGG